MIKFKLLKVWVKFVQFIQIWIKFVQFGFGIFPVYPYLSSLSRIWDYGHPNLIFSVLILCLNENYCEIVPRICWALYFSISFNFLINSRIRVFKPIYLTFIWLLSLRPWKNCYLTNSSWFMAGSKGNANLIILFRLA
jgi:hypothetical protein